MALPIAYLPRASAWARAAGRFVAPPRWASSLFAWSASAAFAAGALHSMRLVAPWSVTFDMLFLALVLGILLFLPLLLSGALYFVFVDRRTATSGAAWCAAVHVLAHVAFMHFVGASLIIHTWVPLLVAGTWGMWLPRAGNPEGYPPPS